MTKEQKERIRRVYGILLSAVIVIAGVCLMTACVRIYTSGDHPYSPESVASHFAPIAVPVYLCLAMVLGSFVLELFLPAEQGKLHAKNSALILKNLQKKADLSACDPSLRQAVTKQRKMRCLHRVIGAGVLAVGSVIFLIYALNPKHFLLPDINGSMIRAMEVLIPCFAIPFAYALFSAYFSRTSVDKEIGLLRQICASGACCAAPAEQPKQVNRFHLPILRCAIVLLGLGLALFGFFSGGTADVLTKAINICTECVGLG